MSANIEQIKAMLERTGKTNLSQKQKVDLDKERLQLEATVNIENTDKGLEEAADDYIGEVVDTAGHPGWDWETHDIVEAFIAGAKWGAEHLKK